MNETMTSIREATQADFAQIHLINKVSLGYDFDLEKTKIRLSDILSQKRDKIFVSERNGVVVGYIHAADYEVTYAPHLKNLHAVAVLESAQKQGVGRMLLNAAELWAKETGAEGIRLVSSMHRKEAHKFYFACGYESSKDQKNFIKRF